MFPFYFLIHAYDFNFLGLPFGLINSHDLLNANYLCDGQIINHPDNNVILETKYNIST